MKKSSMSNPRRCIAAAVTLFFVSPLVAEFLLGDFSIAELGLVLVLAPMYGGGALLIRELARRCGRGWPTMLLLSAVYALFGEGFVTESLFNPNYLGMHFLSHAWIPSLGIGAWWTLLMLNVHVFWSMGVSIALVEGLFPSRARDPWLGYLGIGVAAAVFVAGNASYSLHQSHFHASAAQFTVTAMVCVALVAVSFLLPRFSPKEEPGWAPSPWLAGAAAFVLAAVFLLIPSRLNWGACALILAIDLLFLVFLRVFSQRSAWTPLHTLSIGAAGAVAYGIHAFTQSPVIAIPAWIMRSGNAVFLTLAIAVIAIAARRTRSWISVERDSVATPIEPSRPVDPG